MEIYGRYGRPMLLAETGTEFEARPEWLRYAAGEVALARCKGVPMEGLCLYPILNHFGWDDDRPCQNGLLEHGWSGNGRTVYRPLADELARWTGLMSEEQGADPIATWTGARLMEALEDSA